MNEGSFWIVLLYVALVKMASAKATEELKDKVNGIFLKGLNLSCFTSIKGKFETFMCNTK